MILYTPLSEELIFQGIEDMQAPVEMTIHGITMQVERLSDSQARIVRLLSPNPQDYLNASYQPGAIVQFTPEL